MDKFKQIWNNPRYNALIRLGLWFIFFTLVIVFIRLSPKEEVPKKEEKVQITYNDIKKEFANSSVMLTMSNDTYYVSGVIKDGVFNGTIQNDGITNKVYYDGVMYIVNKNNKEEKICKVTYEKDNLVYTLEYNYL